ncbi:unnamed protein product, partial [Rotaria socialis]
LLSCGIGRVIDDARIFVLERPADIDTVSADGQ